MCKRQSFSSERKKQLVAFCKPLGLRFRELAFLELAFRHRSYSNESGDKHPVNNERLEFLGDSRIKAVVVSEKTLAPIALRFGIDKMLVLGHGEELSGGRNKPAILADCMESIIGAYFLDSGYAAAEKYVLSFLVPEIEKVHDDRGSKDYKTLLQELYQKKTKACPLYETVSVTGPDHDRTFSVTVHLGTVAYGPESGKSKKEAEQKAAKKAYMLLTGLSKK